MASRPAPNYLPKDLLVLVGKIAIQTAYMDYLLVVLLAGLKGVTREDVAKKTVLTARKIEEAERLLRSSSIPAFTRVVTLTILSRASVLLKDRNLIVHSIIRHKDNKLDKPVYMSYVGPHTGKDVPFSKETLEPIYADFDNICIDLLRECIELKYHEPEPPLT